MDKISKAINKLNGKERQTVKKILLSMRNGELAGLDLKKLKGRDDIYRVRKGKIRIVYRTGKNGEIFILTIERRSDNTYNP